MVNKLATGTTILHGYTVNALTMSRASPKDEESTYVGFDLHSKDDKRKVRMRAAQLGYQHMSDYVRSLVYEDLKDANLPLE